MQAAKERPMPEIVADMLQSKYGLKPPRYFFELPLAQQIELRLMVGY